MKPVFHQEEIERKHKLIPIEFSENDSHKVVELLI